MFCLKLILFDYGEYNKVTECCVPPTNPYVETLPSSVMAVGGGGLCKGIRIRLGPEGGTFRNGICAFERVTRKLALSSCSLPYCSMTSALCNRQNVSHWHPTVPEPRSDTSQPTEL